MRATVALPAFAERFDGTVGAEAVDEELEELELEELELDEIELELELELEEEVGGGASAPPPQPASTTRHPANMSPSSAINFGRVLLNVVTILP